MSLPPAALAIAEAHAARDRDALARLVSQRLVRHAPPPAGVIGVGPFRRDIEARVGALAGRRPVNLAIRPNRAKRKKR